MADSDARRSIPLSEPDIETGELRAVEAAVRSGWISGTGPDITAFENALASRVNRRHVIATANGTLALELALRGMSIGPGDEVVVPALTFAAPALSVLAVGATPVLADVDPETWTIDVADVARKRTSRTKAVIAVDVLGHPCGFDALDALGIPVVEDAAEAHGARYRGAPVGSFGLVSTFSFHANKTITTGEGGCVATDSDELAATMRHTMNHGMTGTEPYVHRIVGRNFRMTNVTAAIGVEQVRRWDDLIGNRTRVWRRYVALLDDVATCQPRPVAGWAQYSCWLHCITVADRGALLRHLRAAGIDARPIWPALSWQPVLAPHRSPCPVAEDVAARAVFLPTSSKMTEAAVDTVCAAIKAFYFRQGAQC